MSKLPLIEGVKKYTGANNISFCMPGHKSGLGFQKLEQGRDFLETLIKGDITEVDGADNLHHPEGIIEESLELLSDLYGSKKSYFLVNGSTSGNLTMIFSCFNEGDKIIVERNCHRSIFNGIIMRKLKPVYIKNKMNYDYNAPLSIDMEHFLCLIRKHTNAKGIVLTYPNYYGVCADLSEIIKEARAYGMKVLVDSAHGAHFGFHNNLPESALKMGADIVVMSAHKTLPSLTQSAYMHVGGNVDIDKVDFYFSAFTSTSPSYLLMCSLDYARGYLEERGSTDYDILIERCKRYRSWINNIEGFHILEENDVNEKGSSVLKIDPTRYVLNVRNGLSGAKLFDYLASQGITAELHDASNVVLIFSPFNEEADFVRLYAALRNCELISLTDEHVGFLTTEIPKSEVMPWVAMERPKKRININEAEGKISAANIVPYPPGIPVIMMGESITSSCIEVIKYYLTKGITILGVHKDGFIDILEESAN